MAVETLNAVTATLAAQDSSYYVIANADIGTAFTHDLDDPSTGSPNTAQLGIVASTLTTPTRAKQVFVELLDHVGVVVQSFTTSDLSTTDTTYTAASAVSISGYTQTQVNSFQIRLTGTEGGGMADSVSLEIDHAYVTYDYSASVTHTGIVSHDGTGAITAIGTNEVNGVAPLDGTASITATPNLEKQAIAILDGTGAVTAVGTRGALGVATLGGTATITAVGTTLGVQEGIATLAGTASITPSASITFTGVAPLSGTGSITAVATKEVTGVASVSGTGSVVFTGSLFPGGAALLASTASVTFSGSIIHPAVSQLDGAGSIAAVGTIAVPVDGIAVLSGSASINAVAEVSVPVTLAGRITAEGFGTFIAVPTRVKRTFTLRRAIQGVEANPPRS